jgi:hypothetical protein
MNEQPPASRPPEYSPPQQPPAYQPPAAPYQPPAAPFAPPVPYSPAPYGYQPQARSPEQWQAYVKMQLGSGQPPATLLAEMAQSGVPQPNAYQMVRDAITGLRNRAYAAMGIGAVTGLIALAITVATETSARANGGVYIIWYGPMAVGVVSFVYGVMLLRKVPRL